MAGVGCFGCFGCFGFAVVVGNALTQEVRHQRRQQLLNDILFGLSDSVVVVVVAGDNVFDTRSNQQRQQTEGNRGMVNHQIMQQTRRQ